MADTRKEFFARKPANQIRYTTVEIFNASQGLKRFVTGQKFEKSLRLESDAPRNEGQLVVFEPVGFLAPEPEQGEDGSLSLDINLGAVGVEAKEYIDLVVDSWPPTLEVVLREHIQGITYPTLVLYFEGQDWIIDELNAGIQCEQINFAGRDISIKYTPDVFKGLVGL